MKLVDLKCPNCGGVLEKQNDNLVCHSCGGTFAMDYDPDDVEYQKELLEKKFELQRQAAIESDKRAANLARKKAANTALNRLFVFLLIIALGGACVYGVSKLYDYCKTNSGIFVENGSVGETVALPNYNVTPEDVVSSMDDFVQAGRTAQMNIEQCAYWDGVSSVKYFNKTDAVFLRAFLITDIPNVRENQSNRLVLIYEVTWHNDNLGDQTCYDAVYYSGLTVNPNGGVISNFNPGTILRSDAAWGYSMAYSFEEYDQCYRENVTAFGGNVTEVNGVG